MFQLNPQKYADFTPLLVNEPVTLRPPSIADYAEWAALREESRAHLTAWEDEWTAEEAGFQAFRRRLKMFDREAKQARAVSLFIFLRESRALLGGVTLTNIRYGAARAGTLGYWIGAPYTKRGYGAAAVNAVLMHVFDSLGLNRVEAACQPENAASQKLLKKCGFREEGLARDYLRINGEWRDHVLFARIAADHRA